MKPVLSGYLQPGKLYFSPNPGVNQTILWLLDQGCPPLPIAPRNERLVENGRLIFSGKNPSFVDYYGNNRLVKSVLFQSRLPRVDELKRWFRDPRTGVATLGGWQSTVWIDIDQKHFASAEACVAIVRTLLQHFPELRETVIERTQSGGFHLGVRCRQPPTFSRCYWRETQQPLGDLIGHGKTCVLAPTEGVGGRYKVLRRDNPIWIDQVADLGIGPKLVTPVRRNRRPEPEHWQSISPLTQTVELKWLISQRVQEIVSFPLQAGDRSGVLTSVAREALGWEQFASRYGLRLIPDAESFCLEVGVAWGIDPSRVLRILDSSSYGVPIRQSLPGLYSFGGSDRCLSKIRWAVRQG